MGGILGADRLGMTFGVSVPDFALWSGDHNRVACVVEREPGDVRLTIAQLQPLKIWEIRDGKDLDPVMWVGTKLLVLEEPYYKDATSEGRRVKAL